MPAAAAARSLERIAIIVRPVGERRSRATITPTRHTIASTSTPKITRGYASPLEIPRFQPNSVGLGDLAPLQAAGEALEVEQQRVDRRTPRRA